MWPAVCAAASISVRRRRALVIHAKGVSADGQRDLGRSSAALGETAVPRSGSVQGARTRCLDGLLDGLSSRGNWNVLYAVVFCGITRQAVAIQAFDSVGWHIVQGEAFREVLSQAVEGSRLCDAECVPVVLEPLGDVVVLAPLVAFEVGEEFHLALGLHLVDEGLDFKS